MHREIFGPVIVVNDIASLDEGIALANASEYGLTSSIFTRSLSSAMRAISELRFGETYVNRENFEAIQGFHAGVRKSGIGGTDGKRSEEHTSELQSLMRISYAVFCLKKKNKKLSITSNIIR